MKLKFLGKVYRGNDDATGVSLTAQNGQVVEVSEKMGERLLKDYPHQWDVVPLMEDHDNTKFDDLEKQPETGQGEAKPPEGDQALADTPKAPETQDLAQERPSRKSKATKKRRR